MTLLKTIPQTFALGGLVAAAAFLISFPREDQMSWAIGAITAGVVGVLAFVLKTQLAPPGLTGSAAMKGLLAAQGISFMFRLVAVGLGAVVVKDRGLPFVGFVLSFAVVSLAQQVLETRTLLAARNPVKSSEATP